MKKIYAILSVVAILSTAACSKDFLETTPTDKVAGPTIFSSGESAMVAVNGIYRAMYSGAWSEGWEAENGGMAAYNLVFDLYAEDHIMDNEGSGWFYYDYAYNTWGDYTDNRSHAYGIWNFFYTIICNANYIIANEKTVDMEGATEDSRNWCSAIGQAYALRSMAYMWLVQAYQQNGGAAGSETRKLPGVPVYTEPTVAGSEGKGRGTVEDVYKQANSDIDKAIELIAKSGLAAADNSYIGLNVAYGLKARHAMVQRDYAVALEAAKKAMEGGVIASMADIAKPVNDASVSNVMWGFTVQKDHSIQSWDIFDHMDADGLSTYSVARHLIGSWLYDQIPEDDARLAWWTAPLPEEEWGDPGTKEGSKRSWCNKKMVWKDAATSLGDHVMMRTEEMYLIAAEAACHQEQYTEARKYLSDFEKNRMEGYETRLDGFKDSNEYNGKDGVGSTTDGLVTLMDEILFQRRVEFWSELPRMFDLQRLDLGFDRCWEGTNHTEDLSSSKFNTNPHSPQFILHIPQSEFDGNENMDSAKDQNPSFTN